MSSWNSDWEEEYPEKKYENDATVSIPLAEYHDLIVDARTWYARAVEQRRQYMDDCRRRWDLEERLKELRKFLDDCPDAQELFKEWKKANEEDPHKED